MTLAEAVAGAERRLAEAGVAQPRLDARILVCHALGIPQTAVIATPTRALSVPERRRIARLVARRARREPVSRILGRREFWSLSLRVMPATLDPRPDSETLVQAVLDRLPERGPALAILDLGTGTGCLLLALLSEYPQARGLGLDIAAGALRTARRNAAELGLSGRARFAAGDWAAGLARRFDLVVANPPYIEESEIAALEPELAFEPRAALSGGRDGLEAYRRIAADLPGLLLQGGLAALEIGSRQAASVTALLVTAGLTVEPAVKDLGGHDRVLLARPAAPAE